MGSVKVESYCRNYSLWKKRNPNDLISDSWLIREWAIERERSWSPIIACFYSYYSCLSSLLLVFCFLSFLILVFYVFFPFFFSLSPSFSPLYCARLWLFILPTETWFAIFTPKLLLAYYECPSKTAHWSTNCPATTTILCWLCHVSFLDKSGFVFFLLPLGIPIWIRANPLPYRHL